MIQVKLSFPFIPSAEELTCVVKTKGGACYVLDTDCKALPQKEIINRERKLLEAYAQYQDALSIRSCKEEGNVGHTFT